jgi:hypothetical protein
MFLKKKPGGVTKPGFEESSQIATRHGVGGMPRNDQPNSFGPFLGPFLLEKLDAEMAK